MKGLICYYSNTGNTLLGCQYINKKVETIDFEFYDIRKNRKIDFLKYDILGFATYADGWTIPVLMKNFINSLPMSNQPAFVFNTYGYINGKTTRILSNYAKKKGFKIVAYHALHTPENFPPQIKIGNGCENAPNEVELQNFNHFIDSLNMIGEKIENNKIIPSVNVKISPIFNLYPDLTLKSGSRFTMGKKFVDDKICIECSICEKNCSYGAIKLQPKPVFDESKCHGCWACYNLCPKKAIYTKKYKSQFHYPKPNQSMMMKLKVK